MYLPNAEHASIERERVVSFLLNVGHLYSGSRARTFRQFGYNEESVTQFEDDLLSVARLEEVAQVRQVAEAMRYTIDGVLTTPSGRPLTVRTVWEIRRGTDHPRLLTAFPRSRSRRR